MFLAEKPETPRFISLTIAHYCETCFSCDQLRVCKIINQVLVYEMIALNVRVKSVKTRAILFYILLRVKVHRLK